MDCCRAAATEGTVAVSGFTGVAAGAGLALLPVISGNSYKHDSKPPVDLSEKNVTYPLKGAEVGLADVVERDSAGGASETAVSEPLEEEPPLFSTLLALLINLAKICGFSSAPPELAWAEELIAAKHEESGVEGKPHSQCELESFEIDNGFLARVLEGENGWRYLGEVSHGVGKSRRSTRSTNSQLQNSRNRDDVRLFEHVIRGWVW